MTDRQNKTVWESDDMQWRIVATFTTGTLVERQFWGNSLQRFSPRMAKFYHVKWVSNFSPAAIEESKTFIQAVTR